MDTSLVPQAMVSVSVPPTSTATTNTTTAGSPYRQPASLATATAAAAATATPHTHNTTSQPPTTTAAKHGTANTSATGGMPATRPLYTGATAQHAMRHPTTRPPTRGTHHTTVRRQPHATATHHRQPGDQDSTPTQLSRSRPTARQPRTPATRSQTRRSQQSATRKTSRGQYRARRCPPKSARCHRCTSPTPSHCHPSTGHHQKHRPLKEGNRLRDRLKEMLSRHLTSGPRTTSHSGSSTDTPPQASTHQPRAADPAPHDQPTDPASSTTCDPTTADATIPEAEALANRPSGTESAAADPAHHDTTQQPPPGESPDPHDYSHDNAIPRGKTSSRKTGTTHKRATLQQHTATSPRKFPYRMPVWERSHNFPRLLAARRKPTPQWPRPEVGTTKTSPTESRRTQQYSPHLHDWASRAMGAPHRNTLVLHRHRCASIVRY